VRSINPTRSSTSRWWASRVAGQAELSGQHRGGAVGHGELLDDRQPNRFTQRRVHGGTSLEQPVHEP
jgi:hypothetical protein